MKKKNNSNSTRRRKEKLISLAEAMYDGGIRLLELTFSADGHISDEETAENIRMLTEHFEDRMYIGVGNLDGVKSKIAYSDILTN